MVGTVYQLEEGCFRDRLTMIPSVPNASLINVNQIAGATGQVPLLISLIISITSPSTRSKFS